MFGKILDFAYRKPLTALGFFLFADGQKLEHLVLYEMTFNII